MGKVFSLLLIMAIGCCSCSNGNSSESATAKDTVTSTKAAYDTTLPTGKVIDNAAYALYLPSGYSARKSYPCVYFFDAHARGALPIYRYKELAEKYGFVIVASNLSKNGMQPAATNDAIRSLLDGVAAKVNIDPRRVYTSGFSGGSRVASSVAIFNGGIAGVIGCAAGFPGNVQQIQHPFDYFGMVGDADFNLPEMLQLDQTLEQNRFTHQLLTFDGIHGWPNAADFETAMLWMQVCAMKENLQPKNDTLIKALQKDFSGRLSKAKKEGDWIKMYTIANGAVRVLSSLTDVSTEQQQLSEIGTSVNYKKALDLQRSLEQDEKKLQQELAAQFASKSEKWWQEKITELNGKAKGGDPQQAQMNMRLLSYLGLVGYMSGNQAIAKGELNNAASYLHIFKMADPKNPDVAYLTALYFMKKGDAKQAIFALNEAASLGYSEVSTIQSEPAFAGLKGYDEFIKVVEKMKTAYSQK